MSFKANILSGTRRQHICLIFEAIFVVMRLFTTRYLQPCQSLTDPHYVFDSAVDI
jgi:hypothetical protein